MNLKKHKDTFKLSTAAITTVILVGVAATIIFPDSQNGKHAKFFTPLIVGILFGTKIYLNELEKFNQKITG